MTEAQAQWLRKLRDEGPTTDLSAYLALTECQSWGLCREKDRVLEITPAGLAALAAHEASQVAEVWHERRTLLPDGDPRKRPLPEHPLAPVARAIFRKVAPEEVCVDSIDPDASKADSLGL